MVAAGEVVAFRRHDLVVQLREQRTFVVVAADVQGLQAETFLQRLEPEAFGQRAELLGRFASPPPEQPIVDEVRHHDHHGPVPLVLAAGGEAFGIASRP